MNKYLYVFVVYVTSENPDYYGFESDKDYDFLKNEFISYYNSIPDRTHFKYIGLEFYKSHIYNYDVIKFKSLWDIILHKTASEIAFLEKTKLEEKFAGELIGKTLNEVENQLKNYTWRVHDKNMDAYVTTDYNPSRLNIYIENGLIIDVLLF